MKHTSVIAHIRQICCLGLGGGAIMPTLLKALHDLVPSDSNAFFWVDENDDIADICAEKLLPPEVMSLYFREFYDYKAGGFRSVIARTAKRELGIDRTNRDPGFYTSDYYNLVWREHLNAHHVMYAVIQEQGRRLGQLSLYRSPKDEPYSREEGAVLGQVTHYVAYGLTAVPICGNTKERFSDTDGTGLIIINARGEIQHVSKEGKRLLFLASYATISRQSLLSFDDDGMPPALQQIGQNLQSIFCGLEAPPPVWNVVNSRGRFVFRAFWLDAEQKAGLGLIGVSIQHQEPLPLRLLSQLKSWPFTDQQKRVILLLSNGASYGHVASALNVTTNTANYHVRQIYDRLQVHNRDAMLDKLLTQ